MDKIHDSRRQQFLPEHAPHVTQVCAPAIIQYPQQMNISCNEMPPPMFLYVAAWKGICRLTQAGTLPKNLLTERQKSMDINEAN